MKRKISAGIILILNCAVLALGQKRPPWKEYVYADDGFAVTLPSAPLPHKDLTMPHMNTYTVHLSDDVGITLRVSQERRDCVSTLATLKDGALHGKQLEQPIDSSSVKDFSLNGHSGVEYEFAASPSQKIYDRFYCVQDRFYIFTAHWPTKGPRPADLTRIIESFRLLNPAPH